MYTLDFHITNLTCGACVKMSTSTLRKLPGVTDVTVDLPTGAAHVTSEQEVHLSDVVELLKTSGYIAAL